VPGRSIQPVGRRQLHLRTIRQLSHPCRELRSKAHRFDLIAIIEVCDLIAAAQHEGLDQSEALSGREGPVRGPGLTSPAAMLVSSATMARTR